METLCRIRDIYRAIAEFEVKFMQEFDLSLNEGMLLCTLLNTPKLTSSEIAEALGLSASNTSKVIRSVEDKKLITRLVGKTDKRQMHFALTPEGKSRITVIKNSTPERRCSSLFLPAPKFRPYCRRLFRERLSGLFMVIRPAVQYGHGTV